ncbi:LysR substrate-binding domain-containing protein [Roseateles sp. BYS180W]|uniref:LysR substrate-binding domain-containing protein n=1 Tax=Roseateles rivi TaxID=3299028 RepID=A0ABW7FZ58_9BURK
MLALSALHDMVLFVEVARTASFSRASRNLQVPPATLSRRIAAMEREFAVRLFDRTTRRVVLTEAGQRYYERCAHLVDQAKLAQEALRESAEKPSGHVRLSMPVDLGVVVIGPLLSEFAQEHPGISFELDLSSRNADLVGERVDLAIRLGQVRDEQLVARQIGSVEQRLFASPAYLARRGVPVQPACLVEHDGIFFPSEQRQSLWRLQADVRGQSTEVVVRGRFFVNNISLMRGLAERGMGVAMLDPGLVQEPLAQGRLVPVLPTWSAPRLPMHAVMASRLQPASVRAVLDYLVARLAPPSGVVLKA